MHKRLVLAITSLTFLASAIVAETSERIGEAAFAGSLEIPTKQRHFGGFSAIDISQNGKDFTALSDQGVLFFGTLNRNKGVLAGATVTSLVRLRDVNGEILSSRLNDSEGLAVSQTGQIFVSYEGLARVALYASPHHAAKPFPLHADFVSLRGNQALEALAIAQNEDIYTIPEITSNATPVYKFSNGHWFKAFTIDTKKSFRPVGADIGPDGFLYILERRITPIGFQSRIRRFELGHKNAALGETVFLSEILQYGNLEGLSVWRDEEGYLRFTMVSDNNFQTLLRSEIVEYRYTK